MPQPTRDHAYLGARRGMVMHAKLPSPRPALAICSLLLLFPMACAALTATFKKIADSTTLMPAGLNPDQPFTNFSKILALDTFSVPQATSIVTYSGGTASATLNSYGMYNFHEPPPLLPLQPVAQNQLAPSPSDTFLFGQFGSLSTDQGQLAFAPHIFGGSIFIGLLKGAPGSLNFAATNLTPMPGYPGSSFGTFDDVSISNGQVVWRSQSVNISPVETGVYSDLGGVHAIAVLGDAVPGLSGETFYGLGNFSTVVADGPDIAFYANSVGPTFVPNHGIYKYSGGVLSTVMDSNTSRPGAPLEKFSKAHRLAMHQGAIAFAGEWVDLTAVPVVRTSGVYSTAGGLHTVADIHMQAPGFGTEFTLFSDNDGANGGGVAIFEDVVAFVAYVNPFGGDDWAGIYVSQGGGPVEKLLAENDFFDGKQILDLSIRRESLNANPRGGYSLAFWVQFMDMTQAIYRADFGTLVRKPVRKGIAGTGNIAVLRQGSSKVEMRDPVGGALLGTLAFLNEDYVPISAAALPDSDGNGVAEIAVLAERVSDGRPIIQVRNITGAEAPRNILLAADTRAIAMSVIASDVDDNGIAEIAVLSTRNGDGRGLVQIKNAFGEANTEIVYASLGLTPVDLEVVEDADGNGVPEVAILGTRISDGRTLVEVSNASGALNRHTVTFMPNATNIDLAVVDDADNNAVPEIAVLSWRNSDRRAVVEVMNAAGALNPVTYWLARDQAPLAIESLADADGNTVPELATLSTRNSDGRIFVDVVNAAGAPNPRRIAYVAGFTARSLAILDDLDSDGVPEAAVVMVRDSDGQILVQCRNAAGSANPKNYFLSP